MSIFKRRPDTEVQMKSEQIFPHFVCLAFCLLFPLLVQADMGSSRKKGVLVLRMFPVDAQGLLTRMGGHALKVELKGNPSIVQLPPGRYLLRLQRTDFQTRTITFSMPQRGRIDLQIELKKGMALPNAKQPGRSSAGTILSWVGIGVGVAAGITGGIAVGVSTSEFATYARKQKEQLSNDEINLHYDAGVLSQNIGIAAFVVCGVALLPSALYMLFGNTKQSEKKHTVTQIMSETRQRYVSTQKTLVQIQ